jgi:hypothetical protein
MGNSLSRVFGLESSRAHSCRVSLDDSDDLCDLRGIQGKSADNTGERSVGRCYVLLRQLW